MEQHLVYKYILILVFFTIANTTNAQGIDIRDEITHHYANNENVKIHYVAMGEGPLLLFIHGFPDFWYTWRNQMMILSKTHSVIAMDLRGYNLSDKPKGVENYSYKSLMGDIEAVIKHSGGTSAAIVAHDWGAAISWNFAAFYPTMVNKLVVLNIAHPQAGNKQNTKPLNNQNTTYADYFLTKEFRNQLTENWFAGWVKDPNAKKEYKEAFRKSSKESMLNYYKMNFPTRENLRNPEYVKRRKKKLPKIQIPVLIIHGKKDSYAATNKHNNTWDFIDNELTIVVLPNAGHFTQRDETDKVTKLISAFLTEN